MIFKKSFFVALVAAILVFSLGMPSFAEVSDENLVDTAMVVTPEDAIGKYIQAVNAHNWADVIDMSPTADYEENVAFFYNQSYIDAKDGIHSVDTAELNTVIKLDSKDLYKYDNADYYFNLYGDLELYLVGVDYTLYKESANFHNGLNFSLVTLAQEDGEWKVILFSQAPATAIESHVVRTKDNEDAVAKALEIIYARYQGIIKGSDGTVIETNIATPEQILEESGGVRNIDIDPAVVTNTTRPDNIKVYRSAT